MSKRLFLALSAALAGLAVQASSGSAAPAGDPAAILGMASSSAQYAQYYDGPPWYRRHYDRPPRWHRDWDYPPRRRWGYDGPPPYGAGPWQHNRGDWRSDQDLPWEARRGK